MEQNLYLIKQTWSEYDRFVLIHLESKSSVIVDILREPNGDGYKAHIWNLYVNEFHRNKKIGSLLLENAEILIRERGERIACLEWEEPTPNWVHRWYERQGYRDNKFNDHCVYMMKCLI